MGVTEEALSVLPRGGYDDKAVWICRYGLLSRYSLRNSPVALRAGDYVVILPNFHDSQLSTPWVSTLIKCIGKLPADMLHVAMAASPVDIFLLVKSS